MIDSNIPKIPIVLAGAGLAVVLLLGFALNPTPAFANPPPHDHGGGGDDPVLFSVVVEPGTGGGSPWVDTTTCPGFTDGALHAGFPSGCGGLLVQDISGGSGSLLVYPWSLEVTNRKNRMTARLYFVSELFGSHPANSTVFVTDFLPWAFVEGSGGFTMDVNETNEVLVKLHQPDKGQLVGTVSIGNIVYTELP